MNKKLFTSESVSSGHPDKVCDQISDAVLDAFLKQDPNARVACETFATTGLVVIGGEITADAWVNFQDIAREVLRDIGYVDEKYGISANGCSVLFTLDRQSSDIALGVNEGEGEHKEAGAVTKVLCSDMLVMKHLNSCHCQLCCRIKSLKR